MASFDLNDVRVFVAIADARTLSGAASTLGVPTSTASRSLTRLEKDVGVLLVKKTQRGVLLTDASTDYLDACKRVLQALKDGAEQVDIEQTRSEGLVRVRCPVPMTQSYGLH